jgi:tripartite-type tricarboxylate transporter receptor subunit TctC
MARTGRRERRAATNWPADQVAEPTGGFMKRFLAPVVASVLLVFGTAVSAQEGAVDFPNKPIRLITPFAPGATTDVLSRIIAEKMQADWGQPVVVDNKPGATGLIGTEMTAKSPADGYTLVNVISTHVLLRSLVKDVPIDPVKDFEPVILLARTPLVLVVANSLPVKNAQEFVAYAKANPGKLGYGTSGIGSAVHLTMEQFKQMAGIDVQHVPYKGGAPALQDLLGGHVPVVMSGLFTATQAIKAGQIRALFVTSAKRSPLFPDVPTAEEAGFPGLVVDEWWAILAPAGTPKAVVAKLNAEITKIFNSPEVKAKINNLGIEFVGGTLADAAAFMAKESAKNNLVLQRAGVKPE